MSEIRFQLPPRVHILFVPIVVLFLIGCTQDDISDFEPTIVLDSTHTFEPTSPPASTSTPALTAQPPDTPTPIPTSTAEPSATATATSIPTPTVANTPTPQPTATAEKPSIYEIHLAAVGDIMLDRRLGAIISDGRPEYPFEKMAPWLVPADVTVGNFESALGTKGEPAEEKSFPFRSPPEAVEALKLGGFDVVSLANNHALDYGPEALLDGIELLNSAGIISVGAGENSLAARAPMILNADGVTLAFLAYANVLPEENGYDIAEWEATDTKAGLAWGRPEEIGVDVAKAKQKADHVIVLLHSGIEYLRFITPEQQEQARTAIDSGATLVIGHHAHILQKVEAYNGGLIAYGLGNFAFDIDGDPSTMVLHVWLNQDGVARFELIPAVIRPGGQPRPATEEEGKEILAQIGR